MVPMVDKARVETDGVKVEVFDIDTRKMELELKTSTIHESQIL